ncbi:hypothetical protein TcasGA2_TC009379 [Tribolium castaneum]|uniref:Uncharacterized protein n=1 Tax=Tribolium castaneum TaxID=7070 RepID=D6WR03_TRICA|nr:hypothetical protein TcasGA2_TC009379 [Tribolium castaneum]
MHQNQFVITDLHCIFKCCSIQAIVFEKNANITSFQAIQSFLFFFWLFWEKLLHLCEYENGLWCKVCAESVCAKSSRYLRPSPARLQTDAVWRFRVGSVSGVVGAGVVVKGRAVSHLLHLHVLEGKTAECRQISLAAVRAERRPERCDLGLVTLLKFGDVHEPISGIDFNDIITSWSFHVFCNDCIKTVMLSFACYTLLHGQLPFVFAFRMSMHIGDECTCANKRQTTRHNQYAQVEGIRYRTDYACIFAQFSKLCVRMRFGRVQLQEQSPIDNNGRKYRLVDLIRTVTAPCYYLSYHFHASAPQRKRVQFQRFARSDTGNQDATHIIGGGGGGGGGSYIRFDNGVHVYAYVTLRRRGYYTKPSLRTVVDRIDRRDILTFFLRIRNTDYLDRSGK